MYKSLSLVIIVFSLLFVSCKKDEDTGSWVDAAEDYATAEAFIAEIFKIVDEAAKNEPNVFKLSSLDCANITLEADTPGVFPQTLVINFGEVNCIAEDGRRKRGIIKAHFNGRYSETNSVVTITFDNFFINNYKFLNNLSLTNTGVPFVTTQHQLNISNLKILSSSGKSINVNGNRIFKLISGEITQNADDDVFQISGSFSGSVSNGSSITAAISQPLTLDTCRSVKSGLLDLNVGVDGTFNYGDGECDDAATMTIDGRPFFIKLQ